MSWSERTLGSCASFQSGGTPDKSRADFWDGDIPWVSSGEMGEPFISDTTLKISLEAATKGSKIVPAKTVLVVVRGMSLAKEFRVALTEREVAFNQDLKALRCVEGVDPTFLFYALRSQSNFIKDLATESSHGTKKLESSVLSAIKLNVPGVDIQSRAVAVIRPYDDLIENNRRRIGLLEEAARLLYREWFVHLRFPGHEHVRMIDGLPTGWIRSVPENFIASHIGGGWGQESSDGKNSEPAYVVRGTDIPDVEFGASGGVGLRYHPPKPLQARLLKPYDIIFEVSGGSTTQPVARTLLFTQKRLKLWSEPVICASFCKRFTMQSKEDAVFFYVHLREHRDRGDILLYQKESASSLKNFNFEAFMSGYSLILPPKALRQVFFEIVSDLLDQQAALATQIANLAQTRDLLLPRLMSGEIAV